MLVDLDDAEIERLRKRIRRTYASQPHKIKCWLALLEMYWNRSTEAAGVARGSKRLDIAHTAMNPEEG